MSEAKHTELLMQRLARAAEFLADSVEQKARICDAGTAITVVRQLVTEVESAANSHYALVAAAEAAWPRINHNSMCGYLKDGRSACDCGADELVSQLRSALAAATQGKGTT